MVIKHLILYIPSYAGIVSRESVQITLNHTAMHGIEILAADIQNAYPQASSSEKDFNICRPEFGLANCGRFALICCALYGGKVFGRDSWHHLRECMKELGFESSKADPDVWYRLSKQSRCKSNSSGLMQTGYEGGGIMSMSSVMLMVLLSFLTVLNLFYRRR